MSNTYNLKDGRKYIIRDAVPEDASNLIEYLASVAVESDNLTFGPGEWTITVDAETKFIENAVKSSNQYFVVAELEGLIIGSLGFTAGTKPRVAHIGEFGVSVLKEYWSNGIAHELISSLIQWAKDGGKTVSYTHLRAHETRHDLVCRLLLEKKKKKKNNKINKY